MADFVMKVGGFAGPVTHGAEGGWFGIEHFVVPPSPANRLRHSPTEFEISKMPDSLSASLRRMLTDGQILSFVEIQVLRDSGRQRKYRYLHVQVTSYNPNWPGSQRPLESFGFKARESVPDSEG